MVGSLVLRHANTPIPVMIHIGKPWLNKILVKYTKHTLVIKNNQCCPNQTPEVARADWSPMMLRSFADTPDNVQQFCGPT